MKSFIKKFLAVAVACVSMVSVMALTACGGNKDNGVYTFEAELCCADEWTGGGWSGGANGTGLIQKSSRASGGRYLTYTWSPDLKVNFEITAAEDTTANLSLRLSNELNEAVTLNTERFTVKVNGTVLEYTPFDLYASSSDSFEATRFDDYSVGEISLNQGANVISLIVGEWSFDGGAHYFGPVIDAIKLKSDAKLSMMKYTENIQD